MDPIKLGKFIASLRNEKNLTQEDLAEKLYIDKRKISRWECGNSIPEFEMLIKLSEILDVSLYELSICSKITEPSLSRKMINHFKSIKDLKKFKFIKKLKIIVLLIMFILLIITMTYTIKNNNQVEIYEIKSLDDKYYFNGNYIHANNWALFYIKQFNPKEIDKHTNYQKCKYEAYNGNERILYIVNNDMNVINSDEQNIHYELSNHIKTNITYDFLVTCTKNNKNIESYSFKITMKNIYNNRLF